MAEVRELSAADILASFQRELKTVDVEGLGQVFVYEPVSVVEWDAYAKHMRLDKDGITVSMAGIVDGIMARVRNKAGRLLFVEADQKRLIDMPATTILAIWRAIGGDAAKTSTETKDAAHG